MTPARASTIPGMSLGRGLRHPSLCIGAVLTLALVVMALLSLVWTPWPPDGIDIPHRLLSPGAHHWLGTDQFGRDVLSMVMAGAQTSLMVGVLAVAIGIGLGVLLGASAAALGGICEEALMRLTDFTFAFPAILTAIMLAAIIGPGTLTVVFAIGIFNVPVFARLTRGAAKAVWARDYILAARAAGKGRFAITIEHVLPNIMAPILVQGTIQFATAILAEAALSYLGLGTMPPQPSWGRMLFEAQTFLFTAPRLAVFPGVAIALAVLGLNLLGDGLRDLADPRLRRRR